MRADTQLSGESHRRGRWLLKRIAESQEAGEDPVVNRLGDLAGELEAIRTELSHLEQQGQR